jgi:uncharacterized protein (TIGR01777 family)
MRVFVTGGTGLVGSRLIRCLLKRQIDIVVLTRNAETARRKLDPACRIVEGDPTQAGDWMRAVEPCDAVVNLAGENIFAQRWNLHVKQLLRDSRVKTTEHIVQALARSPKTADGTPKLLINASAVGYYGPCGDEELIEDSPPGDDDLARLCVDWENAARAAEPLGMRVALVRIGVVLDRDGGALKQMLPPFRKFVGGPAGSGKQYMSWIHYDDLVGLIMLILDKPEARGAFNGTAPNPVTNKAFSQALGRALHRPSLLRTPAFMLRVILGEVANVVTTGQRVLPRRALELGYTFRFPEIDGALRGTIN